MKLPICISYMTYHADEYPDLYTYSLAVLKGLCPECDEQTVKDFLIGHFVTGGMTDGVTEIGAIDFASLAEVSCTSIKRRLKTSPLCYLCPYSLKYKNEHMRLERLYLAYVLQDSSAWQYFLLRYHNTGLLKCANSVIACSPDYNNKQIIPFYNTFNKFLINSLTPLMYEVEGVKQADGSYKKGVSETCIAMIDDFLTETWPEYTETVKREFQYLLNLPLQPVHYEEVIAFLDEAVQGQKKPATKVEKRDNKPQVKETKTDTDDKGKSQSDLNRTSIAQSKAQSELNRTKNDDSKEKTMPAATADKETKKDKSGAKKQTEQPDKASVTNADDAPKENKEPVSDAASRIAMMNAMFKKTNNSFLGKKKPAVSFPEPVADIELPVSGEEQKDVESDRKGHLQEQSEERADEDLYVIDTLYENYEVSGITGTMLDSEEHYHAFEYDMLSIPTENNKKAVAIEYVKSDDKYCILMYLKDKFYLAGAGDERIKGYLEYMDHNNNFLLICCMPYQLVTVYPFTNLQSIGLIRHLRHLNEANPKYVSVEGVIYELLKKKLDADNVIHPLLFSMPLYKEVFFSCEHGANYQSYREQALVFGRIPYLKDLGVRSADSILHISSKLFYEFGAFLAPDGYKCMFVTFMGASYNIINQLVSSMCHAILNDKFFSGIDLYFVGYSDEKNYLCFLVAEADTDFFETAVHTRMTQLAKKQGMDSPSLLVSSGQEKPKDGVNMS